MSYVRPPAQGVTITGPEVDEQNRGGKLTTYSYEGTYAEMVSQRDIERQSGASRIVLRPNGSGLWQLSSSYPWGDDDAQGATEQPQNVHEIEIQVEQIPCYNSETLRAYMSGTTAQKDKDIGIVKVFVDRFHAGDFKDANDLPDIDAAVTALQTLTNDDTNAGRLFRRILAGTDSFLEYRSVYRRTITAANWIQVQASYVGAGQIWTTAEVEAFEGVPTAEWFGLRPGMQWLKAPPSVQAVAGGKTQIQYYYTEFKQATALGYTAFGGATLLD